MASLTIEGKKALRLKILNYLYDRSDGSLMQLVPAEEFSREFSGVADQQAVDDALQYLANEDLARYAGMGPVMAITHRGVIEIEKARTEPSTGTDHFAPQIIVMSNISNSQIQAGALNSSQAVQMVGGFEEKAQLASYLEDLLTALEKLGGDDAVIGEARGNLKSAMAQLESPRPKMSIIRECLVSLRAISEQAASQGLVAAAPIIWHQLAH